MSPNLIKNFLVNEKIENLINFKVGINQEQEPEIHNKITLANNLDPYGVPLVNINWKMSDRMKRAAKESLVELGTFLVQNNMGRISIEDHIFSYKNLKLN